MRPASTLACAAAFAALTAAPAAAQETGRFQFQPLDGGGYVMLDTQTGQMKQCRQLARELVCGAVPTEDQAGTGAGALHDRIEALEARIAALESRAPVAGLPPEEEFERGIGYMERFFRMFMGLVREFEDDRAPPPAPERT